MRLWYVSVRGPYDGSYVGPFQLRIEAETWANHMTRLKGHVFDFFPCSDEDIRESIKQWGKPKEGDEYLITFTNPPTWEENHVYQS